MIKFLLPSRIYLFLEKIIKFINSIFFLILIIGLVFALILSPPDYIQGDSVRIMYVHVPSALIGLASFSVIALALMGLGVALTGFFPSVYGLYFTTIIMSTGFHYFETVKNSLSL